MREPLQVNDEVVRSPINFHLLLGRDVVLALAAVPFVTSAQRFLHTEVVEAVVDRWR